MTPYLYAAVGLAVLAVIAYPVLTYLIDKPERRHRRPPWWQRVRDRRLEERAQDALNVRLIHDISEGIKRESTGRTSSGMPRADWPLAPLPEGAEEYADHFHRVPMPVPSETAYEIPDEDLTFAEPGPLDGLDTWEMEDPQDVATPEDQADVYVGLEETSEPPGSESSGALEESSKPEPAPLTDYRETTGTWEAIRDDVLAGGE